MINICAVLVPLLVQGVAPQQSTGSTLLSAVTAKTAIPIATVNRTSATSGAEYRLVWEKPLEVSHDPTLISHNMLFALSIDGEMVALRLDSGDEKWKVSLLSYFTESTKSTYTDGKVRSNLVFAGTPIAAGNLILTAISTQNQGKVFAFDPQTGQVKWSYTSFAQFGPSRGAVQSGLVANSEVVVFRTSKGITCLNLTDGAERWNRSWKDSVTSFSGANKTVLMDGPNIYLGADQGVARSFRLSDGKLNWECRTSGLELHEGLEMTRVNVIGNIHTPMFYKDTLITADGAGNVYAINKQSGKVLWKTNVGVTWQFCASNRNSIYAATEKGLAELDATTGKVKQYRLMQGGCFTCSPWQNKIAITGSFWTQGGWAFLKKDGDFSEWNGLFQQSDFAVTNGANYGKDDSGRDYVVLVGVKRKPKVDKVDNPVQEKAEKKDAKEESAFEDDIMRIRLYQPKQ